MIFGVNACRARSGGAVSHLIGLIQEVVPEEFGVDQVHVWSYATLLKALPDRPWLIKHSPPALEGSILQQLWWERSELPRDLERNKCSVLLNIDASSLCRFRPAVTMSRDMLCYEPGEAKRYGISHGRLRLVARRYAQNSALRAADGAVFLTRYAARVIQQSCGPLQTVAYIPHGVGAAFKAIEPETSWPAPGERPIRCLYVSNALPYKHQWNVVAAVAELRKKGLDLELHLVGGGEGVARTRLDAQIRHSDPDRRFVTQREFVPQNTLPDLLGQADLFVFASSCENMPNTLLEAMAAGLPIACSNRGPMPEVLDDGGVYFDPEDVDSTAGAIEQLITDPIRRTMLAARSKALSQQYSWERCARETFTFVKQIAESDVMTGNRPYQICTKLVLDTSYPGITFDADGVCNHFDEFQSNVKPRWKTSDEGRRRLEAQVMTMKRDGKGRDFDCIMGLSGGADSSYMLHTMVTEFGLRPLVFHVDGGWNSEIAVSNINALVDRLGLDLYTEVINWEEMRDFQLAMFKSGVPHIDIPQDMAFIGVLYNFARKYGIKHILNGGNISTECVMRPLEIIYWGTDMAQIRDILSRFGTIPMPTYPFAPIFHHKFYLRYIHGVKVFKPLNFMAYVKREAMTMLQREYGWKPYPQKHFESRFTRFFEGYWLPTRFGFDMRRVDFSSLILTEQMTRDEALAKLKGPAYDPELIHQDFEYIAMKLGITPDELRGYHEMPKKYYWDYSNQRRIFTAGEWLLSQFGTRRGGAF